MADDSGPSESPLTKTKNFASKLPSSSASPPECLDCLIPFIECAIAYDPTLAPAPKLIFTSGLHPLKGPEERTVTGSGLYVGSVKPGEYTLRLSFGKDSVQPRKLSTQGTWGPIAELSPPSWYYAANTIQVSWEKIFGPIQGLKSTKRPSVVRINREIIPLIVLPGIMGTRLKRPQPNGGWVKAWDPDDHWFMTKNYGASLAQGKKSTLIGEGAYDPSSIDVMREETGHNGDDYQKYLQRDPEASARGWGALLWTSYNDLLMDLQSTVWPEPMRHCFELPVHAFGYNWTDSNRASGAKLAAYIKQVIQGYGKVGRECKAVILITHSMGGIVARSACILANAAPQVLGVIHGVQPTTGAPSAYSRIKNGFSGNLDSQFLGRNEREVTALLCNIPGGLELLPTTNYRTAMGKPGWLRILGGRGAQPWFLPKTNPYEEIYIDPYSSWKPSKLLPQHPVTHGFPRAEFLAPHYSEAFESATPGIQFSPVAAYADYLARLSKTESFQKELGMQKHDETYSLYGTGLSTPDEVTWSNSGCTTTGLGDQTVSESSASALCQSGQEDQRWRSFVGVEHQNFYKDLSVRETVRNAIVNLCHSKINLAVFSEKKSAG